MTGVDLDHLPGRELIERGLADVREGRWSVEALIIAIAAPRLNTLGISTSGPGAHVAEPEIELYALLGALGAEDPYGRYNALLREVASFSRALEHRIERKRRQGSKE